jgi:hypothetical protein
MPLEVLETITYRNGVFFAHENPLNGDVYESELD